MTKMSKLMGATAVTLTMGGAAFADGHGCAAEGRVSILSNDFAAVNAVSAGAAECANADVTANATTEHRDIQVAALTADPAEYTVAVVANSSIVALLNEGLVRPLDDLIAAHAPDIPMYQRISVDGNVMAIAFMANAQHLFYRSDVLEAAGVAPPSTYEEVLAAAEAIRSQGLMENPFITNTAVGWNLGEEFVNMYLGHGGAFFEPGTANPAINNETGVATLEMMKALAEYSDPDFLTFASNETAAEWEAGNAALGFMWGSRGGPILDGEGSTEEVTSTTVLIGAPTVAGGVTPASTLWWDGFTIASNISDEDAEASFIAMVHGMRDDVVAANNDAAVWLSPVYQPGPAAAGVAATASSGTKPYPMIPFMGLMHTALGNELAEFLQGEESAEQALADVEAAYIAAATEQGFIE